MPRGHPDPIFKEAVPGEPVINLSYAVLQVEAQLPGWCWKVGTCCVSDDAWLAPDYNDPVHGPRLNEELSPVVFNSIFDAGVDIDRRPPGNVGQALLDALAIALEAVVGKRSEGSDERVWIERGSKYAAAFAASEEEFFDQLDKHGGDEIA